MTGDQQAQLAQIEEHANALRLDFDAAERAGASVPSIHLAKELLDAAILKAREAISESPR